MASWEPIIADEQYEAWVASFHERHDGSPFEVLNGIVVAGDAAYAEAYGVWLTKMSRQTPETGALA